MPLEEIIARSDGVPPFLEQVTRAVLEAEDGNALRSNSPASMVIEKSDRCARGLPWSDHGSEPPVDPSFAAAKPFGVMRREFEQRLSLL